MQYTTILELTVIAIAILFFHAAIIVVCLGDGFLGLCVGAVASNVNEFYIPT